MEEELLEKNYQERLEERIIAQIAKTKKIPLSDAMELYYHSSIADKIATGLYDIQYLDYKILAQLAIDKNGSV